VANLTGTLTEWFMGAKKKPQAVPPTPAAPPAPVAEGEQKEIEMESKADETSQNGTGDANGHTRTEQSQGQDEPLLPAPVTSIRQLTFQEKLVKVIGIYWQDLRVRTVTMILILWFTNLVFPHPSDMLTDL
jgi:hypothetical protein